MKIWRGKHSITFLYYGRATCLTMGTMGHYLSCYAMYGLKSSVFPRRLFPSQSYYLRKSSIQTISLCNAQRANLYLTSIRTLFIDAPSVPRSWTESRSWLKVIPLATVDHSRKDHYTTSVTLGRFKIRAWEKTRQLWEAQSINKDWKRRILQDWASKYRL